MLLVADWYYRVIQKRSSDWLKMAARVIHFGIDDCHRLMVLRNAGYAVDECVSLVQLRSALKAQASAEAVFVSEGESIPQQAVATLTRTHSSAPLILFQGTNCVADEPAFDLVVPNFTPPDVWLNHIKSLIEQSKAIRDRAQFLVAQSEMLRRESSEVRIKSRNERERSRRARERSADVNDPLRVSAPED